MNRGGSNVTGLTVDADVVLVGLGALGSHAAWRLASRGLRVVAFEQFGLGHDRGSSHGETRLFRVACLEHPSLVTIAQRSRQLWHELQAQSGSTILNTTGGIMVGPPGTAVIDGTLAAARAHGLPVELLTRAQLTDRYPRHHNLPDDTVGVWDPEAGVAYPETAIRVAVAAAQSAGADIRTETKVTDLQPRADGVAVHTDVGTVSARQAVVTTGAWIQKFVPELNLTPTRTPMTWFKPLEPADDSFELSRFPVFVRALDRGGNGIWGHGATPGSGVKIGPIHDPTFASVDADRIDRRVSADDHALVSAMLRRSVPALDPVPSRAVMCMVTHTPDDQFVVGRRHANSPWVVGGGGSGHAFKHAAGLGELIAQIVTGETPYVDAAFLDPGRLPGRS